MAKYKKIRFTIPEADEEVIEWILAQASPSQSLRVLVHDYVAKSGLSDPTCRPGRSGRRGRPPKAAARGAEGAPAVKKEDVSQEAAPVPVSGPQPGRDMDPAMDHPDVMDGQHAPVPSAVPDGPEGAGNGLSSGRPQPGGVDHSGTLSGQPVTGKAPASVDHSVPVSGQRVPSAGTAGVDRNMAVSGLSSSAPVAHTGAVGGQQAAAGPAIPARNVPQAPSGAASGAAAPVSGSHAQAVPVHRAQ